jgi:hypothetical protein
MGMFRKKKYRTAPPREASFCSDSQLLWHLSHAGTAEQLEHWTNLLGVGFSKKRKKKPLGSWE